MMDTSPGPYVGYPWQLIGGDPAIDLVNTVVYRLDPDRTADRLSDAAHFSDWLAVTGQRYGWSVDVGPDDLSGAAGRRVLARTRRLREATADLLAAHVAGRAVPRDALELIRRETERARSRAQTEPRLPLRLKSEAYTANDVPVLLGIAVDRLCTRPDLERLRQCADAGCGWYFLDESKNRSRRWCDPGDCGNRARVRDFTARRRG
jgi:predicted RNA-binding Zn ribbon-like protein